MKTASKQFIAIVTTTNILFVFLHIYRQNVMIQLSYEGQRLKKEYSQLEHHHDALTREYAQLTSRARVKADSAAAHMIPLNLKQIQKIPRTT